MLQKCSLFLVTLSSLVAFTSCSGAHQRNIEIAERFPPVESNRILVAVEEVPYMTFKQESDGVFSDFAHYGDPVGFYPREFKTQITGTPYSVSYQDFFLRVFREDDVITERELPKVFLVHPMSSAVILGKSPAEDKILCRTQSRSATGLHYILIVHGNGEILFEKVMKPYEDWDILLGNSGEIIIGGARNKTTISDR